MSEYLCQQSLYLLKMTLIEQKQVQAMSRPKLSAQIHCQLSKYRNHIQYGEWRKVTCPEEHQTDDSSGMHFYPVERTYGQTRLHAVWQN